MGLKQTLITKDYGKLRVHLNNFSLKDESVDKPRSENRQRKTKKEIPNCHVKSRQFYALFSDNNCSLMILFKNRGIGIDFSFVNLIAICAHAAKIITIDIHYNFF